MSGVLRSAGELVFIEFEIGSTNFVLFRTVYQVGEVSGSKRHIIKLSDFKVVLRPI